MPIFAGKKFSSPPAHRYLQWCGTLTQTLRTQALSRDLQPSGLWGGYGWTLGPDPWSGTGDFHRPADPVPECIQPPWASGSLRYISKARLSLIGSHIRARSVDPPPPPPPPPLPGSDLYSRHRSCLTTSSYELRPTAHAYWPSRGQHPKWFELCPAGAPTQASGRGQLNSG